MSADITLEKLGDRMSAEDRETFRTAMGLVAPWLLAENDRFALLHGDYRLDNMLFDPDRTRVSVVDWQTLGVGLPARDLAYFTATSLNSQLRATFEESSSPTITAVTPRRHRLRPRNMWRDYRLGVLQAPLISALGFAFAASTERGDEWCWPCSAAAVRRSVIWARWN